MRRRRRDLRCGFARPSAALPSAELEAPPACGGHASVAPACERRPSVTVGTSGLVGGNAARLPESTRRRPASRIFQEFANAPVRCWCHAHRRKESAMFRVQELTHFGTPAAAAASRLPSAALVGAAFTQTDDDPFFAEINPAAMGYRTARKGRVDSGARRGARVRRSNAFPTSSMAAAGRAFLRHGGGSRQYAGA